MRWAYLSVLEFFLLVTIVGFAVEEAITATTGRDRLEAIGDVFFWLGMAFTSVGFASAALGRTGGAWTGRLAPLAIPAILFGLASIAFSLAVRT